MTGPLAWSWQKASAPFRAFGSWAVQEHMRSEHALIHEPSRMRYLLWRDLGIWAVTVACWAIHNLVPWWWLAFLSGCVVAVSLFRGALYPSQRQARAYSHGWLDGRAAFVASMGQGADLGLTPQQWFEQEAARDWSHISDEPPPWWVDGE